MDGQIDLKKKERLIVKSVEGNHGVSVPGTDNLFHVLTSFKSIDSRIVNPLLNQDSY